MGVSKRKNEKMEFDEVKKWVKNHPKSKLKKGELLHLALDKTN